MTCDTSLNQLNILKTSNDKSAFLSVGYTVEPRFNHPLYKEVLGIIQLTIFFSPAKITIQCMEQNLDITKSRFNEILVI